MLDSGRFRSPCVTCDGEIPRGHPRIAEPCNDGRIPNAKYQFHCLECAIQRQPKLVREILVSEMYDEGQVSDATALKQELQDRIEAIDAGKPLPSRRIRLGPDRQVESLLQPLYDDPDDRDVLAVLADALTERGDSRGELIVLDLALGDDEGTDDQDSRRNELRYRLTPRICRSAHSCSELSWRFGFIDRVAVLDWRSAAGSSHDVWAHSSLRLLRTLSIGRNPGDWLGAGFPALRRLEISGGKLEKLPVSLPRLEELVLACAVDRTDCEMLVTWLDGRKLPTIDASRVSASDAVRSRLAELCDKLVS